MNRSENKVLNLINRDRINDQRQDPIAIVVRSPLLVGCLGVLVQALPFHELNYAVADTANVYVLSSYNNNNGWDEPGNITRSGFFFFVNPARGLYPPSTQTAQRIKVLANYEPDTGQLGTTRPRP